jgi:tripartite-type tricarboxylate transporter receptor subunit TctC
MTLFRRILVLSIGLLISLHGMAQQYPSKPIRMIVPFAPGGGTDVMARSVGQKLSESLGQPVVIDNRPGADTIVAAQLTAASAPDGYTLLFTLDMTTTMNPSLYSKLPYDPVRGLAPVSQVGSFSIVFVTNDKVPVRTLAELVSYAKANPGRVFYGSGASVARLTVEKLKMETGIDMTYVPFKGGAPATQALVSGEVQLTVADPTSLMPYIKSGKIRPIATTGKTREPELPDTPTMIELGYPSMDVSVWVALYAAGGTPKPIVEKLSREVARALATPEVSERLKSFGVTPVGSTPVELAQRQKVDAAKWNAVVKATGIKID